MVAPDAYTEEVTTFLFKDNLVELLTKRRSGITYIPHDNQPVCSKDKHLQLTGDKQDPVTVYCELRSVYYSLDDPPQFPSIPTIHVDMETTGIRNEDLKQLLRDYLSLKLESVNPLPSDCKQIGWEQIDPLSLHDAGYSVCGLEPLPPVRGKLGNNYDNKIDHMVSAVINQLINDAKAGKLKVELSDGRDAILVREQKPDGRFGKDFCSHYDVNWLVRRHDLNNWATKECLKQVSPFQKIESSEVNSETPSKIADVSAQLVSKKTGAKLSNLKIDKVKCQALAKELWKINPSFTQKGIIESAEMVFYQLTYTGKNTLRDWLREVDPRPKKTRRGRPLKNTLHSTK